MRTILFSVLLGSVLLLSNCQAGNPTKTPAGEVSSGSVISMTNETFKQKVFNYEVNKEWKFEGNLPVIIDFYADWCRPYKILSARIE